MTGEGLDGPRRGEFSGFHQVLSPENVPAPDAPWFSDISTFALTFDAYEALGGFEPAAEIANAASDRWHEGGELPDDLIELRTKKVIHKLFPGITGWAQINGRDDLPIPVKVDLDEYYLSNRSFVFDLKTLFLTFSNVLRSKGIQH